MGIDRDPTEVDGKENPPVGEVMEIGQLKKVIAGWGPEILLIYTDSIRHVVEKLAMRGRIDFFDFTAEDLHHYLRFIEASILANEDTVQSLSFLPPRIKQLTTSIAQIKLAFEAKVELPNKPLNRAEKELADLTTIDDLPFYLKLGQEGTLEYRILASRILFDLRQRNGGKDYMSKKNDMTLSANKNEQRYAHKERSVEKEKYESTALNISHVAYYLVSKLKKGKPYKETYREESSAVTTLIAGNFLQNFYARDEEKITEENVKEFYFSLFLLAGIYITQEKDAEKATGIWNTEIVRLYHEARNTIIRLQGEDFVKNFPIFDAKKVEQLCDESPELVICMRETPRVFANIAKTQEVAMEQKELDDFMNLTFRSVFDETSTAEWRSLPYVRDAAFSFYVRVHERALGDRFMRERNVDKQAEGLLFINFADSPRQLANYGEEIVARPKSKNKLYPQVAAKLEEKPHWLRAFMGSYFDDAHKPEVEFFTKIPQYKKLLSTENRAEHPNTTQAFLDALKKPDHQSFYAACQIAAQLVAEEKATGSFTKFLFAELFKEQGDFVTAPRWAFLRYTCNALPPALHREFLKHVAPGVMDAVFLPIIAAGHDTLPFQNQIGVFLGDFKNAFFAELKIYEGKIAREKAANAEQAKLNAPLELLKILSSDTYPERNIEGEIQEIQGNRSIELGTDTRRVSMSEISTLLARLFQEARVKRTKDKGIPPDSLACNIVLVGDISLHCRIEKDNSLVIRILDKEGQTKTEIRREDIENYQSSKPVFDEVHHTILQVLKFIYVRKEPEQQLKPANDGNSAPQPPLQIEPGSGDPETPNGEPSTDGPILIQGLPLTDERKQGRMAIDLTDHEKKQRKELARKEKLRIGTNRANVFQTFSVLAKGGTLPEVAPEFINDLELYELVKMSGQNFYNRVHPAEVYQKLRAGTLMPKDVYVRKGRVFAQPLPFVRKQFESRIFGEPAMTLHKVKQSHSTEVAQVRYEMHKESEGGEALAIGRSPKILFFDDDTENPLNRAIFERIKSGKDIPSLIDSAEKRIAQNVDEVRRAARAKYLESKNPDILRYAKAMERVERIGKARLKSAKQITEEVSGKAKEVIEGGHSVLQMPQAGFVFDQTFNQGTFDSLEELIQKAA